MIVYQGFGPISKNQPAFSFEPHVATIKRRKVVIEPTYCRTIPCPKKRNFKNIGLI